ncbi:hypothetical protein BJX99DRAFT_219542 [Aspergillus californicus]
MRLLTTGIAFALAGTTHAKVASEWLQSSHENGTSPPTGRVDRNQMILLSGQPDVYNESQPDNCPTIMIGGAVTDGDWHSGDGWKKLPDVSGFDLNRLVVDEDSNATMPYYVENSKDLTQVKRVLITIAGLWRDAWKYSNNMRNSLICAAGRESIDADMDRILIAAPQWLNEDDVDAGATEDSDIYFKSNNYNRGDAAIGPDDVDISSFEAMDKLVSHFWDQEIYPEMESIVIASHSLGGQMVQRYAMLRPTQPEDPYITYGIMNPGSYAWLTSDRPARDSNCTDTYDNWGYGIGTDDPSAFPAYVRDEVLANASAIRERYISRKIFYGFGTADDGHGDRHCEAKWQGDSHIERGRNFQAMLEALPGGMPATQSVSYIQNVSHEDYKMMVSEAMQRRMFLFDNDSATRTLTKDSESTAEPTSGAGRSMQTPQVGLGALMFFVLLGLYF